MSVAPPAANADDHAHRPRRIGLRPRDARDGRQRGSARGQMQKLSGGEVSLSYLPLAQPHSITSSARASSVRRNFEAERLGGLEVDHQLELGRRLHRQVGRLLAFEDAVDIAAARRYWSRYVRPVGHQAAVGDKRDKRRSPADGAAPQVRRSARDD